EGHWRSFRNELGNEFGKAKTETERPLGKPGVVWNEIDDFKADHSKFCDDWKEQKHKNCKKRYEQIQEFLASKHVQAIPFTPEIMFHGKRLIIAGLMPNG